MSGSDSDSESNLKDVSIKTRFCSYCETDVPTRLWSKHTYKKGHRTLVRKIENNPLDIKEDKITIQLVKQELVELKESIDLIIQKMDKFSVKR